jgi:hypothetical protein
MRSLIGRLESLEQQAPSPDSVDTIFIKFFGKGEDGPIAVDPVSIRKMHGDWQLNREAGEDVDAFRERASRLCPRPGDGVVVLLDVTE